MEGKTIENEDRFTAKFTELKLWKDYQPTGKHKYTLAELTNSFDASFNYIKANYKSFYVFYGA